MDTKNEYIIWSSSPDTSEAGIAHFCELNAGRYGKTAEEMKAMSLARLIPLMWNDIQSWRLTAHGALNIPTDSPILVIADRVGDTPFAKPEISCFVFSGEHLNEIFSVRTGLSTTFYSDGSNIRCTDISETGADHYLFREITQLNGLHAFAQRVSAGEAFTESELDEFSRSLAPTIHQIYGWPEPGKRPLVTAISDASSRVIEQTSTLPKQLEYSK